MKQGKFNKLIYILQKENKLVIPDLQRDYCWGTTIPKGDNKDRKTLVYKFTDELVKESFNQKISKEYSYGILYTYAYPESFLHLCDGQQRLTTLYLLIGILNCHYQNQHLVNMLQLENGQPRLKYEVRNSTDYFIKDILREVFLKQDTKDLDNLSNANWFRNEYNDDPSIKSIIAGVKDINKLITNENAKEVADFILTKVGFVYIKLEANDGIKNSKDEIKTNLKIREYGEKMYEIVNTCGDPMEYNEHRKSILLSQEEEGKRVEKTEMWEIWQDFFWQNKGEKILSADEGFNEFLNWIDTIEGDALYTIDLVEEYFKAFFLLMNIQDRLLKFRDYKIINIKEEFLRNQRPNLVVLYPCLIYLKNTNCVKYENKAYSVIQETINYDDLFRYVRFFSNVSRNTTASIESMLLAKQIGEYPKVFQFLNIERQNFKSILTEEEIFKLSVLKACSSEIQRKEYEEAFWTAEDHPFLNGQTAPILKLMQSNGVVLSYTSFDLERFIDIFRIFKNNFKTKTINNTQKALLSMTDFSVWNCFSEGSSWGQTRHYLGTENDNAFWQLIVKNELFHSFMQELLNEKSIEEIIENNIEMESNIIWKKSKNKIVSEAQNHWTWNNNRRFFIHDGNICFPNGVQAKKGTIQIPID